MLLSPLSPQIMPPGGWRYRQPETGVEFHQTDLNALRNIVERHRRGNKLDLSYDWYDRWLNELCLQNSNCRCDYNKQAEGYEQPHIILGRALWKELHDKAALHKITPDPSITQWFEDWLSKVPDYTGCRCRRNFLHIIQELPVDYTHNGFESWAVDAHNKVSESIGKPKWP